MTEWVKVAHSSDIGEGDLIDVTVQDRLIALARVDGKLYAFNGLCPHASAKLAEGDLRPGWVICPLHGYRYDLNNGVCLKPRDGPRLRVYPIEERDGEIRVKLV